MNRTSVRDSAKDCITASSRTKAFFTVCSNSFLLTGSVSNRLLTTTVVPTSKKESCIFHAWKTPSANSKIQHSEDMERSYLKFGRYEKLFEYVQSKGIIHKNINARVGKTTERLATPKLTQPTYHYKTDDD